MHCANRFANTGDARLLRIVALQKVAVAPNDLVRTIASHSFKGRIDIDQRYSRLVASPIAIPLQIESKILPHRWTSSMSRIC